MCAPIRDLQLAFIYTNGEKELGDYYWVLLTHHLIKLGGSLRAPYLP